MKIRWPWSRLLPFFRKPKLLSAPTAEIVTDVEKSPAPVTTEIQTASTTEVASIETEVAAIEVEQEHQPAPEPSPEPPPRSRPRQFPNHFRLLTRTIGCVPARSTSRQVDMRLHPAAHGS